MSFLGTIGIDVPKDLAAPPFGSGSGVVNLPCDPDAPNGMTEFLIANVALALSERGFTRLSMNFAAWGRLFADAELGFWQRICERRGVREPALRGPQARAAGGGGGSDATRAVRPGGARLRTGRAAPCALAALAAMAFTASSANAAAVRDYDLGPTAIPDPGPFGPLPIRLWGAIGVPDGPGPHPLVVVVHGRHGTNCPSGSFDNETWPCFAREQRNDLGLRHVVRALAERGVAAVAPDLNGAFTGGWGEPNDRRRWPRIVGRTLRAISADATGGPARFPVPLAGRLDLRRLGFLGHSLSGHRAVRAARLRVANRSPAQVARGRGPLRALFLLTPVFARSDPPSGLPFAVVVAGCDGDTGTLGRRFFARARASAARRAPAWLVGIPRANHNFFNRTLARRGADDAPRGRRRCRPRARPPARAQQRFLARAAADFFAATLRGAPRPQWLRLDRPPPTRLHGLQVRVRRDRAGV